MKFWRRRRPEPPQRGVIISIPPPRAALTRGQWPLPPRDISGDMWAAIATALEPFPIETSAAAHFFGVPMDRFTRWELIRIVSWVAANARDRRRDS